MKVAWVHDTFFIKDEKSQSYYSEIEFPYDNWERYLHSFSEVRVISRQKDINDYNDISKLNLSSGNNVEFKELPNFNSIKGLLFNYKSKKLMSKYLIECDAVIARLPSSNGLLAIDIAIQLNIPYAIELVGCPKDAYSSLKSIKGNLIAPYMTAKTKKVVAKAGYVLYVTKSFLQNRYPTNGKSIACSNVKLKTNEYLPAILPKKIDDKKGIKIGLIGYLSYYKGIDIALKALEILSKKYPHMELHILGAGDKKYWIKKSNEIGLNESSLYNLTLSSGKEVIEWIDSLDIYIQPSRTEGLPRGLIEAMSRGCPAIGAEAGGIPELLSKEFIFPKEDYSRLSQLLEILIKDEEIYKTQSVLNYNKSKEYEFDLLENKRIEFWQNYYKSLKINK